MGAVRIRHSFIRSLPPGSALALFLGIFHTRGRGHRLACPGTERPIPMARTSLQSSTPSPDRAAAGALPEATAHADDTAAAAGPVRAAGNRDSGNRHHHVAQETTCPTSSLPVDRRHAPRTFSRIGSSPPTIFLFNRSLLLSAQLARSSRLGQCLSRCQEPGPAHPSSRRGEEGWSLEGEGIKDRIHAGSIAPRTAGRGKNITPIT
jgi:hypothetical protein